MHRRLQKEFVRLMHTNRTISWHKYDDKEIFITIDNIRFEIIQNYPFHPPCTVYINNIKYKKILSRWAELLQEKNCLCCQSIICGNNWAATNGLMDIVKEIETYKNKLFVDIQIRTLNLNSFGVNFDKKYGPTLEQYLI